MILARDWTRKSVLTQMTSDLKLAKLNEEEKREYPESWLGKIEHKQD